MAFDKLIVNTVVRVAKDNIKFEESIDKLKFKIINLSKDLLKSEVGVNKIPNLTNISTLQNFSDLKKFPIPDINNLVDSETLKKIGEIPNSGEVLKKVEKIETTLNDILNTKNRINNALYKTQASLESTRKTADTIDKFLTGIETGVTIIKSLPLPTAIPPGIGIPIGIINTLSDVLDKLNDYLKKGKGPLSQIPLILKQIISIINGIVDKLNSLDNVILILLQIIVTLKVILKYGPNASESEIQTVIEETSNNIDLSSVGNNVSPSINTLNENELLNCLQSNSNTPCIYKSFILQLEYDPNNKFSFPSRRIKGHSKEYDKLIYNNSLYENGNPEGYSFSSSLETLLEEIKYVIDSYLNELQVIPTSEKLEDILPTKYTPFNEAGTPGEIRQFRTEFYKFDFSKDQWEFFIVDLSPFNRPGNFDGEIITSEATEEETVIEEKKINDWNIFDGKKKYEITTIIYTVIYVSTYIWDNTLYKWVLENKEIKNSTEKSRKIKVIKK